MSAQTSSSQAPETDLPELSAALHQAAEQALPPLIDPTLLVGRVRRKRRTRAVVAAGLGAALLAAGGIAAPRLLSAHPDPAQRTHKPKLAFGDVTEARMIAWLESTLPPGGRLSGATGLGLGQKPPADQVDMGQYTANASLVYDSGHNAGQVRLNVQRWDINGKTTMPFSCPTPKPAAGNSCSATAWPDGGVLVAQQSVVNPPPGVSQMERSACLEYRSGQMVCVDEMNQSDPDVPPTNPEPPLTAAQLQAAVAAPIWQQVMAAIPKQGKLVPKSPSIEKVMAGLLPQGYQHTPVVRAQTRWELGYTSVLTGPQGKGSVFAEQMHIGNKASDALKEFHQTYPHGVNLPNGDWLGEVRLSGESGRGVVWNQAVVVHGNLWITVVALNSVNVSGPPTLSTPVLTLSQLATIAENTAWRQAMVG